MTELIFSFWISALADTISPVIATTIFAQIFRATVAEYPGTVFYVIAGLILVPTFSMTWIYLRTKRQIIDGVNNQEVNEPQQQDSEKKL